MFNPAGGLIYHVRAHRYRDSLWVPFRHQVSNLLEEWNPHARQLLILGPSGGYTLPTDFLERFDKVWLSDPDPLAPFFFRRSHPDIRTEWIKTNLVFERDRYRSELLTGWLAQHPDTAVLFSNLLGQLPLLNRNLEALQDWWGDILVKLDSRSWFSYHDVFSFPGRIPLPARLAAGEVIPQLMASATGRKSVLDLIDHGTTELFADPVAHLTWQLTPKRTHIIGVASESQP